MKIWQFLKDKMLKYGEKIAFPDSNITYSNLIKSAENNAESIKGNNRLKLAFADKKITQAMEILSILVSDNVVVPVSKCYGEKLYEEILSQITGDNEAYEDTAFIMFTSGTTGKPKGVMLTHENIIENIKGIDSYFKVRKTDKILIARPLVHIAVLTGELLYSLYKGMEINFYEEEFNPKRLVKFIEDNKITVFCSTPTMFYHISNYISENHKLRICALSGERLTENIVKLLSEKFKKVKFYNVYGLTENSPRAAVLTPDKFYAKAGSIGKPLYNTRFKIVDGELYINSNSIMKGYYNNPELTQKKIIDGWLHTGDMAKFDEEGYFYILGRSDEMIIRSGLNIYPQEIENVLKNCPGIENCLVYGEEDILFGQRLCLKVLGKIEKTEKKKFMSKNLPPQLIPTKIEYGDIEMTPSGKVKRWIKK